MTFIYKGHSGPRPINTLSKVAIPPQQFKNSQTSGLSYGLVRQLQTKTSVGDNLPYGSPELGHDVLSMSERRTKRRKLDPRYNSQNTPHILDQGDDEDHLGIGDISNVRHVPATSEAASSIEIRPYLDLDNFQRPVSNGPRGLAIDEYRSVEKRMDSSLPSQRKRRDRDKRKARAQSGTPRSSFASSPSDSVEMLDSKVLLKPDVKPVYQGIGNMHAPGDVCLLESRQSGRSTGDRSPHFPTLLNAETVEDSKPTTNIAEVKVASTETRMRDQYRDTDGKKRNGSDPSSPDELITLKSNSRALSPIKTVRSQSPSKIFQQHSPGPSLNEDESIDIQQIKSNIKPSSFTGSVKKDIHASSRTRQRNGIHEDTSPWSLPLHAYYSQGEVYKEDGLEITYNQSNNCYEINCSGVNLATLNPELRIQPKKLMKITWSREGKKMRFESCKIGNVDNVLDIEMCTQKDVQQLNAILQEGNAMRVIGEHEATMEKKFEHRINEQRKVNNAAKRLPSKQPEDVELADVRLNRTDAKRALEDQSHDKPKRPRLIDGLGVHGRNDSALRSRLRQTSKPNQSIKVEARDQPKFPVEDSLTRLDEKLRISLRSHNRNASAPQHLDEHLFFPFEEKIERYSKCHDMGKPWVKPLVYPKEGKKRTTVEWDDLERLDDGQFLNDNLIAFYLRYLECQAEKRDPTISRRVYMFNTFFYERLSSTNSGHKGMNYDAVQKWTRGVDLFTYDFVVVPVHESVHWYVAIICNLPALSRKLGGMDDDLGHDLAPASEQDSEQRADDVNLFSSSPQIDADDVDEHNTRSSFAEMSLGAENDVAAKDQSSLLCPDDSEPQVPDQEALENQLPCSNVEDLQDHRENNHLISETHTPISSKSKKSKRKSGPPLRKHDPYKPSIITFDSFGTPHSVAIKTLKQYLHEEANDKRGMMEFDEKELQGMTAKEIPQQSNFYDCGLYLLGYIEKFLDDPRGFINKVLRRELSITNDWQDLNPSTMRSKMRKLLMGLHKEQRREAGITRRTRANPKPQNELILGPPTEGKSQPSGPDTVNDQSPKTLPEKEQEAMYSNNVNDPLTPPDAASKSSIPIQAPEEVRAEPIPSPPPLNEPPPQSFFVPNSQSQQADPAIPSNDPQPLESPPTPILPSTIPDSQPPITERPVEEEEKEVRPNSPPAPKKPRRIDNFSSPPIAAKSNNKSPKRNNAGGGAGKSTITGTNPKVVIHID